MADGNREVAESIGNAEVGVVPTDALHSDERTTNRLATDRYPTPACRTALRRGKTYSAVARAYSAVARPHLAMARDGDPSHVATSATVGRMTDHWPTELNGRPASDDAEAVLAWGNYGHFTAMQVRSGRTRGLDLHLSRLDRANRELFGVGISGDLVRTRIRHALGGIRDASVRDVSVRVRAHDRDLMVLLGAPADMPARPQAMRSVRYQRPVPHLKHSGGFAQGYYLRQVEAEGFDEALLIDADDVIAEGAITNVGWSDGSTVLWPDAPALAGITMQVLRRELDARGVVQIDRRVRLADLSSIGSMFLCNSWGVGPVNRVDDLVLPVRDEVMALLTKAYNEAPWDEI